MSRIDNGRLRSRKVIDDIFLSSSDTLIANVSKYMASQT